MMAAHDLDMPEVLRSCGSIPVMSNPYIQPRQMVEAGRAPDRPPPGGKCTKSGTGLTPRGEWGGEAHPGKCTRRIRFPEVHEVKHWVRSTSIISLFQSNFLFSIATYHYGTFLLHRIIRIILWGGHNCALT
jgi:hypothetical protein